MSITPYNLFLELNKKVPTIMRTYDADSVGDAIIKITNAHQDKSTPELIKLVIKELNKFVDDKISETIDSDIDTDKQILSKLLKVFNSVSSPEQLKSAKKYHSLVLKKLGAKSLDEFYRERGEIGDLALKISSVISNKEKKYTPVDEGQIYSTGGGAGQSYRKFTPKVDKTLDEDWGSSDWTAALKDFKRDLSHVKNADDIADSAYSIASSFNEPRKYSDDPWTNFTPKRLLDMALRREIVPKELISTVQGILSGKIQVRIAHELDEEVLIKRLSQESSVMKGLVSENKCPKCGGPLVSEEMLHEKKDACYYKVKSRYKVWPSAYASGALVKCRKKGAKNWGKKSVKENKGLPMPGTYEQEYNMFKSKGPERIIAMTNEGDKDVAEGVPQPGKSSGKPISWLSPEKVVTKYLTLDQILNSVPGIPYYNEVVKDRDAKDFTWRVTKKVIEYARELIIRPDAYKNWPPIIVVDGKLQDGAHRISTINLMQKRVQPNNPIWENAKLKVEFGTSDNVKQDVAEGKKRKKKKTSRSLGRYFFPGYGYYGSGESGESGSGDGGGGESVKKQGVAEGNEQKFMIYFVVPSYDDHHETEERTIIVANDRTEAIKKFKEQLPGAYINDIYPVSNQGVAEGEAKNLDENLHKWFKEKWVRFGPDGKIRGDCARGSDSEGKPKCLPQKKAQALGKEGRASAAARKRRQDPNPERSGKAKNVATKKKK